ncbi:hypothetical protein QBC46DRAFT_344910 [Diplogelasinospora grovesii]|uniref:Alpha/beta hydrolase n=1 Tax=Diplogelasinospora grovesii TaxID=303347 RepID=A0AAN6N1X7_9PEZI|nr:hypothetical protein QBC46DRAFT_344910 [Diplogelasinospora grovesii]
MEDPMRLKEMLAAVVRLGQDPLSTSAAIRRLFRWPKTVPGEAVVEQAPPEPEPLASSLKKTFPSGIKLLYSPETAAADIVFVHGLTGDREITWTARGASEPWPKALLPAELPTARVLTFGYDAYVAGWRGVVS